MSRSFQLGFSGGEMSLGMYGLISDAEFRRGLERSQNLIVLPQGGLRRRGGTKISKAVKDSTKKTRVVRFRFADDQAYALELGTNYLRIHLGGAPLQAQPRTYVVSQAVTFDSSNPNNWATWDGEHQLVDDDPIQFTTTGSLPTATGGNITAGVTYYAAVVNSTQTRLRRTPGGATIDLLTNGSNCTGHFAYSIGDVVERRGNILSVAGNVLTSRDVTGFSPGDRVRFTVSGGTIVGGLDTVTDYFVMTAGLTTKDFQVSTTGAAGPAVVLSGLGSGTTTWHFGTHATPPNYYSLSNTLNQLPPGIGDKWYAMPLDGTFEAPLPTALTETDLFKLTYTQSNDVLTLAHRTMPSVEVRRFSNAKWQVQSVFFSPSLTAPTGLAVAVNRGISQDLQIGLTGGAGSDLKFTTDSPHGFAQGLSTVVLIDGTNGPSTYLPKTFYRVGKLAPTVDGDPLFDFTLCKILGGANLKDGTDTSGAYTARTLACIEVDPNADLSNRYVVTAVTADGLESLPSSPVTAVNNTDVQGATNTLTWNAVTGASRYYLYREEDGLFGFLGTVDATATLQFVDDGSFAPDLSRTVPSLDQSLNGLEHPGAVGYFQGRRWFAATLNQPHDAWGMRSGTENDLNYHIPLVDSDRIYFRLRLREFAEIRHIVPTQHLLLLTASGEVRVTPRNSDVLTPTNIDTRTQSYIGTSYVSPLVHGAWVVFAADQGGRIWATSYDFAGDTFRPVELSVRAAHQFDGNTILDSAFARAPNPTLLFVSSSGRLLGCTFLPEQAVRGWFYFDTAGTIESVCTVPEGGEDRIYMVVRRGSTRYIERMESQADAARSTGVFLDAAVVAGAGTVVAVPHPNGTVLDALVDGKVVKSLTVAGGTVTLPTAAVTTAIVGLRYTSHAVTLPLALSMEAFAQGRQLNVNRVTPRLRNTGSCRFGPAEDKLVPVFTDDGVALVSGFKSQIAIGAWANAGQVHFVQDDPLPLEITSLTVEVAIGGE
jgi:hypothetical protein